MSTTPNTPTHPFDINDLIAREDDPKARAFLIILNSLNNSLIANTGATMEIKRSLDEHLTNFELQTKKNESVLNQGRGAWRVMAWVIGVVQAIGLVVWIETKADIKEIHAEIVTGQKADSRLEMRVQALEKSHE